MAHPLAMHPKPLEQARPQTPQLSLAFVRSTQLEPQADWPEAHEGGPEDPFEHPALVAPARSTAPATANELRTRTGARCTRTRRRQQAKRNSATTETSPPVPMEPQPPLLPLAVGTGLVSEVVMPPPTHWPSLHVPTVHVTCIQGSSTQVPPWHTWAAPQTFPEQGSSAHAPLTQIWLALQAGLQSGSQKPSASQCCPEAHST
jgi:hypothetical protein